VLVAACTCAVPATALARSSSFATPTTTTTTTTLPVIVSPTTSTTATTLPEIVTPTTTTTTTTSPVIVTPTTTTTTAPVFATPSTAPEIDDLAQVTVAPDGDGSDVPLGTIDTSGAVPEDLDVTAFPGAPGAPPVAGDGPTFAAGFSCAYQCIKSGVAYPRGIGALLVVETHVPARLFMTVIDDDNDLVDATNSNYLVSDFSWALDHLEPGQTYFAMVAATDENDDTAYAYGHFVTLSERTVHVSIGDLTVTGGPQNVVDTASYLSVDGDDFWVVNPGAGVSSVYADRSRHLDLKLLTFRTWETSQSTICEGFFPDSATAQGDLDSACGSWNTASLGNVDLDVIPAGRDRWTSATVSTTFTTSAGGDPLPNQYGDPRFFHFSAPLTLEVSYS
jgi:hypothetical protein